MCMRCFVQADETLASLPPSLEWLQLALQTPIEVLAFCIIFVPLTPSASCLDWYTGLRKAAEHNLLCSADLAQRSPKHR